MSNWLNALLNVGQGVAEAAARKQQMSGPARGKAKEGCSPCQANANAAARMQKFGLAPPRRKRAVGG